MWSNLIVAHTFITWYDCYPRTVINTAIVQKYHKKRRSCWSVLQKKSNLTSFPWERVMFPFISSRVIRRAESTFWDLKGNNTLGNVNLADSQFKKLTVPWAYTEQFMTHYWNGMWLSYVTPVLPQRSWWVYLAVKNKERKLWQMERTEKESIRRVRECLFSTNPQREKSCMLTLWTSFISWAI